MLALVASCVGKVEESKRAKTESVETQKNFGLSFNGVKEVIPIAHNKIEVYFPPASGGSKEYSYQIYVGNLLEPINVVEQVLEKDYRSLYRYTIQDLDIGTKYTIKVNAKDKKTGEIKVTDTTLTAQTFQNYVADFMGISSVGNVSGIAGIDSIQVRWPQPAIYPANFFGSDPREPSQIQIIILDSSKLTPTAFNNYNLGKDDGKIIRTFGYNENKNEEIIRGLESDKNYYVNIRVIHEGTEDIPGEPWKRSELNNRYFEIKTLRADASLIEYNNALYTLDTNPGILAKTSLHMNWGTVAGVFDHFRVYYGQNIAGFDTSDACQILSADQIVGGNTGCKKVSYDRLATDLNDLPPGTGIQAKLLVCIDIDCGNYFELPTLTGVTGGQIAGFGGIQKVILARNLSELGKLTLEYDLPNLADGYFDGLAVEVTNNQSDLMSWINDPTNYTKPVTDIISDPSYAGVLEIGPYNFETAGKIVIDKVTYTPSISYCFAIYPFLYKADGSIDYRDESATWKCSNTNLTAPNKKEFAGIQQGAVIGNDITLSWNAPSNGVYDTYEIFIKPAAGPGDASFSFDGAIEDTTVDYTFAYYGRYTLPGQIFVSLLDADGNEVGQSESRTLHTFYGLAPGYYNIGILTYINLGLSEPLRSEYNTKVVQCYIDGVNDSECTQL